MDTSTHYREKLVPGLERRLFADTLRKIAALPSPAG